MRKSDFNDRFNWFTNMFTAVLSISLATYAIYLVGDNAMTQPLPPLVLALVVLAGIFALLALYNGIRAIFAPKDTRLDDLIKAVRELKTNSNDTNDVTDMAKGLVLIIKAIRNISSRKK